MNMVCKICGVSVHKVGDNRYHDIEVPDPYTQNAGWYQKQLATIAREVEDLDEKMVKAGTS